MVSAYLFPLTFLTSSVCSTAHKDYPDLAPIPERWTVRVGEHDMLDETVPHYDMEVEKIIVNAGYNPNTRMSTDLVCHRIFVLLV